MKNLFIIMVVVIVLLGLGLVLGGYLMFQPANIREPEINIGARPLPTDKSREMIPAIMLEEQQAVVPLPTIGARERITKKPFGLKVTVNDSPVSPERFSGYHTGVDFETSAEEQDIDLPVYAICAGPIRRAAFVSGYGGLVVQECTLDGEKVTVVYGHIKLASVTGAVGDLLSRGNQFAVLGRGYGSETDGERKHLHLGIHRGSGIDVRGYVQNKNELADWVDFAKYL